MTSFLNRDAKTIVMAIAQTIIENKAELSRIDGLIGDGDHGVNMAKGFSLAAKDIGSRDMSFGEALEKLGLTLMEEIGGSMGPLYGMFFIEAADVLDGVEAVDAEMFGKMLGAGLAGITSIGGASAGDKTMLDTLVPALAAFERAIASGRSFEQALSALSDAAETGRDSTRHMVAKAGRASRLGERSRGVVDAGATSCCLILQTLAAQTKAKLTV